ncbi:TetR family transcriptional regulator [Glutamicibacter sp. ZJUTW]|uniref:TetR/AcrR family transcriptional regulator n=1 Tax=Glutamicibacter sp. ZJUTW TaxID=1155384 RepID=UPI0011F3EC7D|nr:TetR family transcriptional regulator [Glutamicibacter sp. ZJUTW]QEP05942.1 TetR/AcrR family transcriptional regulator [Glutamicibacter sp. ZJUTW]
MSEQVPNEVPGARKRGRPKGSTTGTTKAAILRAASKEFSHAGYEAASLRSVARRAGVDPALVHHYFKDKDDLFVQTMHIPVNPGEIIAQAATAPLEQMGEALVRALLTTWRKPAFRTAVTAMIRGLISSSSATKILRPFLQKEIFSRLGSRLPEDSAEPRVALVASQIIGLIVARYIIDLEPLASMDDEQVIELVAPTIQRYLTGELPALDH